MSAPALTVTSAPLTPASGDVLSAYRQAVRATLGSSAPAAHPGASPIHPFVLSSPAFDATVRTLTAAVGVAPTVVHISQHISVSRLLEADEPVTMNLAVIGARREPSGLRMALEGTVRGADGAPVAGLTTTVLLGATAALEPFGALPSPTPPSGAGAGEPATRSWSTTTAMIRRYAEVSADLNPIHLEDDAARAAGFDGVIAHGMSVLAAVTELAIDEYAGGDPALIRDLGCRFSSPVRPGETVDIEFRPDSRGSVVRFACATPQGTALKAGWICIGTRDD